MVAFDPSLSDHESQQLPVPYTEDAFLQVQFELVLAEICEGLAKVLNVVFAFLALDDNIVNVRQGVSI